MNLSTNKIEGQTDRYKIHEQMEKQKLFTPAYLY